MQAAVKGNNEEAERKEREKEDKKRERVGLLIGRRVCKRKGEE